ncbi:MAG: hypothetical protein KDA41_21775, partial [Planctomycetales bacterium]|nr:hypothetical protein [Planctomycetales bacterium]
MTTFRFHRITLGVRLAAVATAAFVCSAASAVAADVLVGPGIVSTGGADSGERLNIDQANPSATLAPGTYNVSDFSFWSTATTGSVTPFLAQQRSGDSYTTLWVGSPVATGATGLSGAAYTAGTEQFTLVNSAQVFAGHFMSSGARVAFDGSSTTDHDNSFSALSAPNQVVGGFSNPNLARAYSFGVNVDNVSATSAAGLSLVPG